MSEHPVEKVKTLFLQQSQQPQTISLHVGILPMLQAGQGTSCFLSLALRTMKIITLVFVTHTNKLRASPHIYIRKNIYILYICIQTQNSWTVTNKKHYSFHSKKPPKSLDGQILQTHTYICTFSIAFLPVSFQER